MKTITFKLTATNVAGQVVTLPAGVNLALLTYCETLNTGNYTDAATVAPTENTVVQTAPGATTDVQLTSATTLTFGTGYTPDTTYGSLSIRGYEVGEIGRVA